VTDLSRYFDTARYLTPDSDIVALMILGHQTHVQNLLAVAVSRIADAEAGGESGAAADLVREVGEPLVRALLFSGEAPLTAPVAGTSGFADEFQRRGPRDARGRWLRDLDLRTRLMRHPLSYMVYAASFDAAPASLKAFVYRRLNDVLTGQDRSPEYAHLSDSDRDQIAEILRTTKPDFAKTIAALR
jgi:hypothetical protein